MLVLVLLVPLEVPTLGRFNFLPEILRDIEQKVVSAVYDTLRNGDSVVYLTPRNGNSGVYVGISTKKSFALFCSFLTLF